MGVFGLLSGVPLVSFGRLLQAGGRNVVRILSEDDAKDSLELDVVSFAKSTKNLWVFDDFGGSETFTTYQKCGKSWKIVKIKGTEARKHRFSVL